MAPSFPILSTKDLVKRHEGIHKLTEEDILRPTADVIRQVYEAIVAFTLPRKRDQCHLDNAIARTHLDAPEAHQESIGIIRLFRSVSQIVSAADSPWFTIRDLVKPNSARTIRALSAFANFFLFIHQHADSLDLVLETNNRMTESKHMLEDRIAEVDAENVSQDERNKDDKNEAEWLRAEVGGLKPKIQELTKQRDEVVKLVSTRQEQLSKLDAEIMAEKGKAADAKAEAQVLQHQIAQSPKKLEMALKRVEEGIQAETEAKKEESDSAEVFRQKLLMSRDVLEVIKRRNETIQPALSTADNCSKLKSEIQSKACAIDKLKQKREFLRMRAERIPQE
ncbi:unnamed protein product, partial [Closterium sp. NIES-64]